MKWLSVTASALALAISAGAAHAGEGAAHVTIILYTDTGAAFTVPCSQIMVRADPDIGAMAWAWAEGPATARSGECKVTLKGLPYGQPMVLSAVVKGGGYGSRPDGSHPRPLGGWSNPLEFEEGGNTPRALVVYRVGGG